MIISNKTGLDCSSVPDLQPSLLRLLPEIYLMSEVLWWVFGGLTPNQEQCRRHFHKPRANKWDLTHKRLWWPINSALAGIQNEPSLSPNSWLISIRGIWRRFFSLCAGCIHITLMDSFKGYGTQTLIRLPLRPCCWSLDIGSKWNVTSGKRPEPASPSLIH